MSEVMSRAELLEMLPPGANVPKTGSSIYYRRRINGEPVGVRKWYIKGVPEEELQFIVQEVIDHDSAVVRSADTERCIELTRRNHKAGNSKHGHLNVYGNAGVIGVHADGDDWVCMVACPEFKASIGFPVNFYGTRTAFRFAVRLRACARWHARYLKDDDYNEGLALLQYFTDVAELEGDEDRGGVIELVESLLEEFEGLCELTGSTTEEYIANTEKYKGAHS